MKLALGRRFVRRAAPGGIILCYHGVISAGHPSESVANVELRELCSAIAAVRAVAEIVPLRELLGRLTSGASTAGLVALTFDDAYASLGAALPVLVEELHAPLTIFVTTSASARGERFWWDRLDDLFPRVTPTRWRRFEEELGLPAVYRDGPHAQSGPLRPLRQWILAEHKGRCPAVLDAALAALEAESGFETRQRAMTYTEIEFALRNPLVDVGVHTRTHPVLPLLGDEAMHDEVAGAHAELRAHFPTVLPVLAAPFGLVDARTIRIAALAGMDVTLGLAAQPLGDRRNDAPVPRLGVTRGLTPARLTLHVAGVVDRVRRVMRSQDPMFPELPSATS